MRRAFISEAVNFRKDAAGGGDKQADDHFVSHLIFFPMRDCSHIMSSILNSFNPPIGISLTTLTTRTPDNDNNDKYERVFT